MRMIGVVADLQIWRPVGDGTEWSRKSGTLRVSLELLDQAEQEPADDQLVRVHALPIECLWLCCNMLRFVFVLSCRNQKWTMIQ